MMPRTSGTLERVAGHLEAVELAKQFSEHLEESKATRLPAARTLQAIGHEHGAIAHRCDRIPVGTSFGRKLPRFEKSQDDGVALHAGARSPGRTHSRDPPAAVGPLDGVDG